ncbi:Hsp70 family protein, partial [Nocardia sp. NPDC019302]
LGAALRAEAETSSSAARKPVILDVTSQALGTVALNDSSQPSNSIVIPRNTKIPAKASKVFGTVADGQTEVRICVTQGDDEDIDHVRFVTKGKWPDGGQLFAIPPYPANAPVLITFHYDMDQTIQVEITDLTADRSLGTFEVDNVANLSATDIRAARTKNENLEVN